MIYFKYAIWVFIYTILFALAALYYGSALDGFVKLYEDAVIDHKVKSKFRLLIEIGLQLGATAVGVYCFREIIDGAVRSVFKIDKSPDKFAAVVISAVVFSQQPQLIHKIRTVFTNVDAGDLS